jgi:hypothetical protein
VDALAPAICSEAIEATTNAKRTATAVTRLLVLRKGGCL